MLAIMPFIAITNEQIFKILIFLLVLVVLWGVIKAILKITKRLFTFGCGAILALGLILLLLQLFSGQ